MAVLRPLRLVIENYPEGESEYFEAENHPEHPELGRRKVPFSRVRVRRARRLPRGRAEEVVSGSRPAAKCGCATPACHLQGGDQGRAAARSSSCAATWDPASRGGNAPDGRSVRGTLHWVSAAHALDAEVRLYDRLFAAEDPMTAPEGQDFMRQPEPELARGAARLQARAEPRRLPRPASATSSSAWATSASTRTARRRSPRGQPHAHAQGQLGETREEARGRSRISQRSR